MTEKQFDPKMLNALDLAFVGDGVYGLLVRERLAYGGSRPVGEMHRMGVEYVNAAAQAAAYDCIAPLLTEQEQAVYRRGRNDSAASSSIMPSGCYPGAVARHHRQQAPQGGACKTLQGQRRPAEDRHRGRYVADGLRRALAGHDVRL